METQTPDGGIGVQTPPQPRSLNSSSDDELSTESASTETPSESDTDDNFQEADDVKAEPDETQSKVVVVQGKTTKAVKIVSKSSNFHKRFSMYLTNQLTSKKINEDGIYRNDILGRYYERPWSRYGAFRRTSNSDRMPGRNGTVASRKSAKGERQMLKSANGVRQPTKSANGTRQTNDEKLTREETKTPRPTSPYKSTKSETNSTQRSTSPYKYMSYDTNNQRPRSPHKDNNNTNSKIPRPRSPHRDYKNDTDTSSRPRSPFKSNSYISKTQRNRSPQKDDIKTPNDGARTTSPIHFQIQSARTEWTPTPLPMGSQDGSGAKSARVERPMTGRSILEQSVMKNATSYNILLQDKGNAKGK